MEQSQIYLLTPIKCPGTFSCEALEKLAVIIKADCSCFSWRHPDVHSGTESWYSEHTSMGAVLPVKLQQSPQCNSSFFQYHVRCKGEPATVLVLGTWKVSDKSPRRIRILSLHFCFVFPSALKRNQWTYKCAALTSCIVPLGSDTSAAMRQLQAGTALWHWHVNE